MKKISTFALAFITLFALAFLIGITYGIINQRLFGNADSYLELSMVFILIGFFLGGFTLRFDLAPITRVVIAVLATLYAIILGDAMFMLMSYTNTYNPFQFTMEIGIINQFLLLPIKVQKFILSSLDFSSVISYVFRGLGVYNAYKVSRNKDGF